MGTALVCGTFGLEAESVSTHRVARAVELDVEPGMIVLFVGPSGSGKSSLLREAGRQLGDSAGWLSPPEEPDDHALVDALGLEAREAMRLLGRCGLGEARLMLRRPCELSDGQLRRFVLARALAGRDTYLLADEWCATLDRLTARTLSANTRRLIDADGGKALLAATTHEDLIDQLQPDVLVRCDLTGRVEVRPRQPFRRRERLLARLVMYPGTLADWAYFARWHYRGHTLGPVRWVRTLFDGEAPAGICIFGPGPLASPARGRIFAMAGVSGRASAAVVNRHFVSVTRLVLDPRYRGIGAAWRFLAAACRTVPVDWIELASEMSHLVPFAQRAGFVPVATGRSKWRRESGGARGRSGGAFSSANSTPAARRRLYRRTRLGRPRCFLLDNRDRRKEKR
jgi:ABC-type lipoprotein export system ATPase subunit